MSMTKPATCDRVCPECGAQNIGLQSRCWLCYRELPLDAEIVDSSLTQKRFVRNDQWNQPMIVVLTIATCFLVLLVGVGAFASDQGLGIAYVIFVTPALMVSLVTFSISRRRHGAADKHRPLQAGLASFFLSLGAMLMLTMAALALAVLIAVAAMIALIIQCFQALGGQ